MSGYEQMIRETLAKIRRIGAAEPRHIEGWMRLEHGCLDGLNASQFTAEVRIALECIAAGPLSDSEALTNSYGL